MASIELPRIPVAGETAKEALSYLAGALLAAVDIHLLDSGKEPLVEEWTIIFIAIKQWSNSGFAVDEAKEVKQHILEAWGTKS